MKASELRIGFYYNYKGVPVKMDSDILMSVLDYGGEYDFTGIPLTEEWLIRFGFKDEGYGEYTKTHFLVDCEYTDKGEFEFCHLGKRLCTIHYIHQLQNLYFALTGEELIWS